MFKPIVANHLVVTKQQIVGSRFICNPMPLDTDLDILVLTTTSQEMVRAFMDENGYNWLGDESYTTLRGKFDVFEKGDVQYIVTWSEEFYECFRIAAAVAKKLNMTKKHERVALHDMILHREDA
jgi:hypothetical protein|tara:strand:- start:598 stop:969 length:372 start_codon:yes stop_codon:yes gene_type:complete